MDTNSATFNNNIKKLNEIIEDDLGYLNKSYPILLELSKFLYKLTLPLDTNLDMKINNYYFTKMNASESFKIVKEFIDKYYPEDSSYLNKLFNSGIFNIKYIDDINSQIEKEKIGSWQGKDCINIHLFGDSRDIVIIMHEIRHILNDPTDKTYKNRNLVNDLFTEGLSVTDEFLIANYYKTEYSSLEADNLMNYSMFTCLRRLSYVNFVLKLILIKDNLGYINIENYKILFGSSDFDNDLKLCRIFLSQTNSYKDITLITDVWYVLGLFIASYLYNDYLNTGSISKFKKVNESLILNKNFYEIFSTMGLNILYDEEVISILRSNLTSLINENIKSIK